MPQLRAPRITASLLEPARLITLRFDITFRYTHRVCAAGEGPQQRGLQDGPGVVKVHDGHEARLE
eukprot:7249651-Alexandrium_andersonii.AAC.1